MFREKISITYKKDNTMKKIIIAALIGSVFSVGAFAADATAKPVTTETHKAVKTESAHKVKAKTEHKHAKKSHVKSVKKADKKVESEKAATK